MSQPPASCRVTFRPRAFVVGLACVVLALVIGLLVNLQARKGATPGVVEIPRKDLVLRDGLLYRADDPTPFTGVATDAYGGGELKSRSQISSGLPHGFSVGYYTNGLKQVEEHFRDGVSHGLRTKWHENGSRLSTVMIVDGKLDGTFQRWHEDGTLAEQAELKGGLPDGVSRAYYPSGFLKAEVRLREGRIIEQHFWKDGEQRDPGLLADTQP